MMMTYQYHVQCADVMPPINIVYENQQYTVKLKRN